MFKKLILILFVVGICVNAYGADISKVSNKQVYKTTLGEKADEVIIGDEKSQIFKPQVTFTKWNKEVNLSIISDKTFATTTTLNNNAYQADGQKEKFYFKVNPDDNNEFKFGLILKEKPDTNKFTYQLEGWEDLDFYYQYADYQDWEKHPEILVSETDSEAHLLVNKEEITCYKKYWKGYTVYHKTKRDYCVGGTNYGIGKIGNFIRPKFIDADGNWELGDIEIKDGIYTLTISQNFLDKAKYPILVNDTFGDTSAPTTNSRSANPNTIVAGRFQLTVNGTVTKITAYYDNEKTSTQTFYSGVYDDDDGSYPSNLEIPAGSRSMTGSSPMAWYDIDVTDTPIVAGYYWFGFYGGNNNEKVEYDIAGGLSYFGSGNHPNPFPDSQSSNTDRYGIYATYTSSSSIALTGTVTSSITEADIVAGGKTIILTLTGDTWVATGATFNGQRQNIINGIDSAQSETHGWDAEVKAKIAVTDVVRTSDTVCTITLDAEATYNITATETITATIPATALTGNSALVASPTFTVSAVASGYSGSVIIISD